MRRFTAAALLVFGITLPLCAQRGSTHGGGSAGHSGGGHVSGGFHSGFNAGSRPSAPPGSFRYAPYSHASRFLSGRPGVAPRYAARIPGGYGSRRAYPTAGAYRSNPYRSPYRSPYRRRGYGYGTFPWSVPWIGSYGGWIDSGFDDYPDDSAYGYDPNYDSGYGSGYDNTPQDQSYAPYLPYDPGEAYGQDSGQEYAPAPGTPGQSALRPQYQAFPNPNGSAPRRVARPANQPTITLVFKDHRPNQQIHNYLLNGTTLSVWDQHPREISVDQIDLSATESLNRDAGIEFHLPTQPR